MEFGILSYLLNHFKKLFYLLKTNNGQSESDNDVVSFSFNGGVYSNRNNSKLAKIDGCPLTIQ